jgi:DNA polymerase-3 subunit delta'
LPDPALAQAWLKAAGVGEADRWLALAGNAPFLAVELASGEERALLEALLAELARGAADPLAAAAALDRVVKADKRPALPRLVEWAQKWLGDLILLRAGQAPRYFPAQAGPLGDLAARADLPGLLAFGRKALQYRRYCEQPVNSRLFLEDFFLNYASLFAPLRDGHG